MLRASKLYPVGIVLYSMVSDHIRLELDLSTTEYLFCWKLKQIPSLTESGLLTVLTTLLLV